MFIININKVGDIKVFKKALVIALMGMSSFTFAGNWQVKFGGSVIAPSEDTTTPLGVVKADHEYAFTPSVEYFFGQSPFSATIRKRSRPAGGDHSAHFLSGVCLRFNV